jgi:hypothetical protein
MCSKYICPQGGFQNVALGIIFVVNVLSAKCLGGCLLQLEDWKDRDLLSPV